MNRPPPVAARPHARLSRPARRAALLAFAAMTAAPVSARSAGFADVGAALALLDGPSLAWGDYDNDGDLDILIAGRDITTTARYVTKVYRNGGGPNPTFTEAVRLPGVDDGGVTWGDYDNDGFLDILATGSSFEGCGTVSLYRSNGGPAPTFSWVEVAFPGLYESSVAWGDYDNDGDLDALVTGTLYYNPVTTLSEVFRNDGGALPAFSAIGAGLPGALEGSGTWGDYDSDGDLDILLTGTGGHGLHRNEGGPSPAFSEVSVGQGDLSMGSWSSFGDYDGDGDLDILVTGDAGSGSSANVYRSINGFYSLQASKTGGRNGAGLWGDYDNDGDLDFVAVGYDIFVGSLTRVYRNDTNPFPQFNDAIAGLPAVGTSFSTGAVAWGDYDNDGDLDLLLAGASEQSPFLVTGVYRNDATTSNTPPTAPTNLAVNVAGTRATFSWDAASDAETPAAGLSYNLRVGTSPGAGDIVSPMADPATGTRRVPAMGNTNLRTSWEIELPSSGTYYWSVQAVDGAFAGSPFAPEGSTGATAAGFGPGTRTEGLTRAPNPFSRTTTIRFSQAAPGPVSLRIYDVTGRRIRTLDDGKLPAGSFARTWDGRDDGGRPVAAGVYFARLSTVDSERSEKVTLVR